jgi:hypothetical protein
VLVLLAGACAPSPPRVARPEEPLSPTRAAFVDPCAAIAAALGADCCADLRPPNGDLSVSARVHSAWQPLLAPGQRCPGGYIGVEARPAGQRQASKEIDLTFFATDESTLAFTVQSGKSCGPDIEGSLRLVGVRWERVHTGGGCDDRVLSLNDTLAALQARRARIKAAAPSGHVDEGRGFNVAGLAGAARTVLERELGPADFCASIAGRPVGGPCADARIWYYKLYHLRNMSLGGGSVVVVHLDADGRVSRAAWTIFK